MPIIPIISKNLSPMQKHRQDFLPKLPNLLLNINNLIVDVEVSQVLSKTESKLQNKSNSEINSQSNTQSNSQSNSQINLTSIFPHTFDQQKINFIKPKDPKNNASAVHHPLKVGVLLSGGQAAGGHNVITGLFDALKKLNPKSSLLGFRNGPIGLINNDSVELTADFIAPYRNQGGFDMIGSGRDKIETPEQFAAATKTARDLKLDGLVIVGGDDSNTNAALLAEYYMAQGINTKVVGVPKTIDGDLKNEYIETSFGFDTATKTFSDTIGSLCRDALSAKKYYFFVKLMGRSASHIALECARQTHPNLTLIGEEVASKRQTLRDLVNQICDMICQRANLGKNYGVVLIPEGLIEFIPEFRTLIQELNRMTNPDQSKLTPPSLLCFKSIPAEIQKQLLLDRDPHGNVQVSKIETERFLIAAVSAELKQRKEKGEYTGKFSAQPLFCGYEGRSCFPSNFDTHYCYSLGHVAALLIDHGLTGYMSLVNNLSKPIEDWIISGVPLVKMIHMEERHGKLKPVIEKALVNLNGVEFLEFKKERSLWATNDHYCYPGPIQF